MAEMKKRFVFTAVLAATAALAASTAAFAGQWRGDYASGWWWQEDDGSWPAGEWKVIDAD